MRAVPFLLLSACAPLSAIDGPSDGDPTRNADAAASCIEGDYLAPDARLASEVGPCGSAIHAVAGAGGSTLSISVDGLASVALVSVESFDGTVHGMELVEDGEALLVDLPWSGEFLVYVTSDDPAAIELERTCVANCDLPWTRYPLFFMHGMAGTDAYLDRLDYWFQITDALEEDGYTVFADAVDPFQRSALRSGQWATHLDALFAAGHHRRVNLIGHSQGGLDARYVTSHLDPENRVASVLTIGTPHRGTAIAGLGNDLLQHSSITASMLDSAFDALASFYGLDSDQDIVAQIAGFDPEVMEDWNADVPDRADVYYASWGGKSCQAVDVFCLARNDWEVVTPLLAPVHAILSVMEGDNDGLVSVESARWGVDYGVMAADHLDEVGQIGGLTSLGFDHVAFYREEAAYLYELGF